MEEKGIPVASDNCTRALWNSYEEGFLPVIPDIKLRSPGEGELLRERDPVSYAKALEAAGASVISVVTEEAHYGGSLKLLEDILREVKVPVLRKDFIRTREQLIESRRLGVSAVLLIASVLGAEQLKYLYQEAVQLGLEPLVEIHNQEELYYTSELPISFLGINNRNILEWETDSGNVGTTEALTKLTGQNTLHRKVFLLSESSISSRHEVQRAAEAGAHGVLIGTAILKAEDPVAKYQELLIRRF